MDLTSENASLTNSLQSCGGEGRRLMISMLSKRESDTLEVRPNIGKDDQGEILPFIRNYHQMYVHKQPFAMSY